VNVYVIILLVVVAFVSLLITRVATIALTATGMTRASARFQARSALTGVGFTTSESETIVNHPARRRVVMALMLIGNVGLATAVAGILAGFIGTDAGEGLFRTLVLVLGLATVYAVSRSSTVDRHLSRLISKAISRYTDIGVCDYERLLHLAGEYSVKEMAVDEGSWLAHRTLGELRLRDEGLVVLGVALRNGTYVGVPDKNTYLEPGSMLVVYGRDPVLLGLARRSADRAGRAAHRQAVVDNAEATRGERH
jgi:K+/H+ antiporter YhaU regulatory subunit KhtT